VQLNTLPANGNYVTYDLLADFKGVGGVQQGSTVVRNHIKLSVTSVPTAGDEFLWGILVGQNTDIGANIAGAPDPFHDHYEDWMFWENCVATTPGGAGACFFCPQTNVKDWDIKSKRKLDGIQESLNLVIYRVSGSVTLTVNVANSTLLMLP
jgi:hypothetical protein